MGSADGSLCSGTYGEGGCDEPHLALLPAALAMEKIRKGIGDTLRTTRGRRQAVAGNGFSHTTG